MSEITEEPKNSAPPGEPFSTSSNDLEPKVAAQPSTKRSFTCTGQVDDATSPTKRSKKTEIEMRCLVPAKCAGSIIGKGGSNIKDMRETFKAQIQLPDADSHERVLKVCSNLEKLGEIVLRILPSLADPNLPDAADKMTLKLLIHKSQVGSIIGSKGFTINELREKTGAVIRVQPDCIGGSTDRVCSVTGKPEVISSCFVLILEMLQGSPLKGRVENYDPAFNANRNFNGNGFNNMGSFRGNRGGYEQRSRGARGGFNRGSRGTFSNRGFNRGNFRNGGTRF